jgi:hypothetical protein
LKSSFCQKSLQTSFMLAKFYDTRKISIFTFPSVGKWKTLSFFAFPLMSCSENLWQLLWHYFTFFGCLGREKRFTWFATAIKLNLYCENAYDYCCSWWFPAFSVWRGTFHEFFMLPNVKVVYSSYDYSLHD